MNRIQPCDVCGCPELFHTPRAPAGRPGPRRKVCEDCSRRLGRDQDCGAADD